MIIYLSLLVCLVGMVLFFVCNPPAPQNPRTATWAEIGRIMFAMGLLAFLMAFHASQTVGFLR